MKDELAQLSGKEKPDTTRYGSQEKRTCQRGSDDSRFDSTLGKVKIAERRGKIKA